MKNFIVLLAFCQFCMGGQLLDQANALYARGKMNEAIKAYKKASVSGENPALCYYNAANAFYQLDSLAQALVYYRACVNSAPDYARGYLNLAVVCYTLNDMGNCITAARRNIELDTLSYKGMLILASAYRATGDLANAALLLEKITEKLPAMEEPYAMLGEIFIDLGDKFEAKKWLQNCPSDGKNSGYVFGLLADLFEQENDFTKAIYYCQRGFDADPSKKWVLYKIILLQKRLGNNLVALETARDGMVRFPEFPEMAVEAGNLAFENGKLEEAEQCYTVALKHGSSAAVVGLENVRQKSTKQ